MNYNFENVRQTVIGTVEFVSPKEIKVLLDIDAPLNTSLNTGTPQLFPRINGYLLIPNELGAIIGIISWVGIEYSPYPKRKGYKDFDIVDLPFPLRKLSLSPLGILKGKENGNKMDYEIERGVYSYPSVGDIVVIPSQEQLRAIVQNKDRNARVKIGTSPLAANAPVYVDPDKLFGRHLAILGNTGSGKSCSVAGLIRWSLEAADKENKIRNPIEGDKPSIIEETDEAAITEQDRYLESITKKTNARFIIFDPNGEYGNCFDDIVNVKRYEVRIRDDSKAEQLKVPSWMWNSWEWASIAQATEKTQRPILRRALREIKNAGLVQNETESILFKNFLTSFKIRLINFQKKGAELSDFPGKQNYGEFLENIEKSLKTFDESKLDKNYKDTKGKITEKIKEILDEHKKNASNYYPAFSLQDVNPLLDILKNAEDEIGPLIPYEGPDEDSPVFFRNDDFLTHINQLAQETNQQQYLEFFIMRVRSLFTDKRIASVIGTETAKDFTLEQWLEDYIGNNEEKPSVTIIDLSLLPSEILYLVVSVMARIIFEAHYRYKKQNDKILPTVLVVDEAHNLIKRYETEDDNISAQRLCTQIFEKIAKEGRKFGVGLVISSQRPSELSQTVLSQCNTFLLHRIVNDRDQEMVKKLVPDTMGGIFNELSVLPSRKAILLGWAAPIPTMVEMNELKENHQPKSKDPDFWDVWVNKEERAINWSDIVVDWQQKANNKMQDGESDEEIDDIVNNEEINEFQTEFNEDKSF
ncbi:ATP-binding protein [Thermoanaerobacter siderophilus]|uniref:Putative ATPase n=1 Tax=Thermoanaerobacter siderophilus SR4 TaxID=880478 RepID=I8R644_9THEO|nr:ATP-binding protein [Thermoanaerobacter siderophilus]EIW01000.1 putative ATPase [Thermoanaerobacter siderophilus SR4]